MKSNEGVEEIISYGLRKLVSAIEKIINEKENSGYGSEEKWRSWKWK